MTRSPDHPDFADIADEAILEPDLPIVDPHHHLWYVTDTQLAPLGTIDNVDARNLERTFRLHRRYLFDELLADVTGGHNVVATIFMEAHAMYRADGPEELKSTGEVEFANGVAAMSASGIFGKVRLCAGIVGGVDLRIGSAIEEVLASQLQAGGGRLKGVRPGATCHDDRIESIRHTFGQPGLLGDRDVRAAVGKVQSAGLSLDLYLFDEQLPEAIDLARTFPDLPIILNHSGGPIGIGPYANLRQERFALWSGRMRELAQCPNVVLKVGGLGMAVCGFPTSALPARADSRRLAEDWRPHVEACIEIFGAERCMFESNFPVDGISASYPALWNAFKRIVSGASDDEKRALFSGVAARAYRIDV